MSLGGRLRHCEMVGFVVGLRKMVENDIPNACMVWNIL